jgi:hypothetical protein
MKDNTVKLSGHAKDRFLERFFAEEPGLDADTRRHLVMRGQSAFTSLRVRKALLVRKPTPVKAKPAAPQEPSTPPPTAAPDTPFDPYVFGLVPVFQREGAEGLLAKLGEVASIENLRSMAKSQQVVLPPELRAGDASPDAIRAGIVEAVQKRIKDRRAAAG